MRRTTTITLFALLAMASVVFWTAYAQNPHFQRTSIGNIDGAGCVDVGFKIVGLGSQTTTPVTVSYDVTATYACKNRGGNCPNAANKRTVQESPTTTEDFPVRRGQTTGEFSICPPPPPEDFCPGNQQLVLTSVEYSNITLSNPSAGSVNLGGRSQNFFPNCPGF